MPQGHGGRHLGFGVATLYPALMSASNGSAVVVIGAGAAGIAAARELRRHKIDCVVLEARDRIGGRAWTQRFGAELLDLGCEWLHSADRNVLAGLAPSLGRALDKREPPWRRRTPQIGFGADEQDVFDAEQTAFYTRLEAAADAARRTGHDRPAADFIDPNGRWTGLLEAISTYYNGVSLDGVSVLDFDRYVDTEVNWRVEGGYGALVAAAGAGLSVRCGGRVDRIDATGRHLAIETSIGTITTGRVIVTVPTDVLASGAIRFDPPLDAHLHAAAGLPLGLADKLFFHLDDAEAFAPDTRLIGAPGRRDTGSYALRSGGRPIVEGYFGGDYARHLEQGGMAAFADAARREIAAALGRDIGAKLTPLVATAWARDPFAMGSYSHALPGHADDRAVLATPVDGRIFFAGEATSRHFFSTAHGAFEEGTRVAALAVAGGARRISRRSGPAA